MASKNYTKSTSKSEPATTAPSSGKTPFITSDNAMEAYEESRKWYRPYLDPIPELERIARNKPSDKIDPELPRITDGTMAAIIQEDPKRIIQQLATGLAECKDYPGYAKIADIIHREKLLPMYNRMGTALQKHWNMLGKAMTWGRSGSYTFFTTTNGQFHTDFVIPYVTDLLGEKGKVYAPDSNILFMRSWYQKRDLQAIINREKAMMAKDKNYKPEWDLKMLAEFMETGAEAKPAELQTPAEKEKGDGYSGGYQVIHAFQEGMSAEFYSFAPRYEQGKSMRTKLNKDPRGKMPIDFEYCNIDLSNPLGRGSVELSGGIQNLIDQQMQMFQFLTTLLMGPPLQVYGTPNKRTLKFRPNALWDMGSNANNKVVPYEVNNHAIQQFGNNYGLLKSQIFNLNSSQDHSISADSGNVAQSKTQAGVQAGEARLGVSDNYLRKQHEAWMQSQTETSINIFLAEMKGDEKIQLKGDELKEVLKTEAKEFVDKNGVLKVPYSKISEVSFKFKVDPSSSEVKEDADNADKLTEVYKVLSTDPDPAMQQKKEKVLKLLVDEIGAEGTDDLFPEEEMGPDGQPAQQPQQPGADPNMIMQQLIPAVQQMVQQSVQQAMNSQDNQIKEGQLQLKSRELDLKEQQMHTDTLLKADKQAHDTQIAVVNAAKPDQPPQPGAGGPNAAPGGSNEPQGQPLNGDHPLNPDEQQFAQALFQRNFSEGDVEQAIVMKRQGMTLEDIVKTLGSKYAGAQQ